MIHVMPIVHALVDAAIASVVLAAIAWTVCCVVRVDALTRARWWSAVAVVPMLAMVVALVQPAYLHDQLRPAPDGALGTLLADPLDAPLRAAMLPAPAPIASTSATVPAVAAANVPWIPVAFALWAVVASVLAVRTLAAMCGALRLARAARPFAHGSVDRDAASARVTLRVLDDLATPVAIGLGRRVVVIPAALTTSLSEGELRSVILHEIAHLRHRDDWLQLLERFGAAVLWFVPVVPLALLRAAASRELACDAWAARASSGRTCAKALWRTATLIGSSQRPAGTLALWRSGSLVERVEALMRPAPASRPRNAAATAVLVAIAIITSCIIAERTPALAWPGAGTPLVPTGAMHVPRASFAAVKLRDGRVLVAGGMVANHHFLADSELYDPARHAFAPTGSLTEGRTGALGVLLNDGRVLVAGGWAANGASRTAELYDPATGRFTATSPLHVPRAGHTMTLLRDGSVLVTGGEMPGQIGTATAEIYDPKRGTFTATGSMLQARVAHTATLLPDGRVLVTGGLASNSSTKATELYDPAAGRFTAGPAMIDERSKHAATLLIDGTVLVTGGSRDSGWSQQLTSTERFDPRTGRFSAAAPMHEKRFKIGHGVVRLPDGDVLVAGGARQAELYDAARDVFRTVGSLGSARDLGAAILLDDGSVLIAGGYDNVDPLPTTETALIYR